MTLVDSQHVSFYAPYLDMSTYGLHIDNSPLPIRSIRSEMLFRSCGLDSTRFWSPAHPVGVIVIRWTSFGSSYLVCPGRRLARLAGFCPCFDFDLRDRLAMMLGSMMFRSKLSQAPKKAAKCPLINIFSDRGLDALICFADATDRLNSACHVEQRCVTPRHCSTDHSNTATTRDSTQQNGAN